MDILDISRSCSSFKYQTGFQYKVMANSPVSEVLDFFFSTISSQIIISNPSTTNTHNNITNLTTLC